MKNIRQNANQTRQKILEASLELFHNKGFAGTSLSQIAKIARVNQSLIAHHFGNKEKLFKAVKESIVPKDKFPTISQTPVTLREFISAAIEQRLKIYAENPTLYRLVSWERLENIATRKQLIGTHTIDPMQWLPAIQNLQAKNLITRKYTPELILIWILHSINAMLIDDFGNLEIGSEGRKHYIAMITDGLEKGLS